MVWGCIPMAVLMVLFGCVVAVVLTAHTMQFSVCAACVPTAQVVDMF